MFTREDLFYQSYFFSDDGPCSIFTVKGTEALIYIYDQKNFADTTQKTFRYSLLFPLGMDAVTMSPISDLSTYAQAVDNALLELNNWWNVQDGLYYEAQLGVAN